MVDALNGDERLETMPLVGGPTSLVTLATAKQTLTLTRTTDARTALTRALAEYVAGLSVDLGGGRDIRFTQVLETWSEPEVPQTYPSALVYAQEPGEYDASRFTPRTVVVPDSGGQCLREAAEFVQTVTLEIWATDPFERMALVAMLEDSFEPVDWMTGFRLELPHYYGARATFEKLSMSYEDEPDDDRRGWRRASFSLKGSVPQIRAVGILPLMRPRLVLAVAAPSSEC